jgi:hypothetical protein
MFKTEATCIVIVHIKHEDRNCKNDISVRSSCITINERSRTVLTTEADLGCCKSTALRLRVSELVHSHRTTWDLAFLRLPSFSEFVSRQNGKRLKKSHVYMNRSSPFHELRYESIQGNRHRESNGRKDAKWVSRRGEGISILSVSAN